MVAWRRCSIAFGRNRCPSANAEFLQRRTSVPMWRSHAFGLGMSGFMWFLFGVFISPNMVVVVGTCSPLQQRLKTAEVSTWTFHRSRCVVSFSEKHGCHVLLTRFTTAVPVNSRPRTNCECVWCLGFVFVLGPRGGGQATWFVDVPVFGTVRSVPVQVRFSHVCLTSTLLDMIFSFAVMSVSFCEHPQCLIRRRFSTRFFTVRLSKQIMLEIGDCCRWRCTDVLATFWGWVVSVQARLSTVTVWSCSKARFVVRSRQKSWWVSSFWSNLGCTSEQREQMWWATCRLHVRLWFVSIGVRSCRWAKNCRDAVFRWCVVGTWAVRRGLWLRASDSRLAWLTVTLAAHVVSCMLPSGAMVQRHGDSVYAVKKGVGVHRELGWCRVLCTLCPRAVHVVYVSGPRESLAFCHMHFSWRIHVDRRVVWHIILAFALLDVFLVPFSFWRLRCSALWNIGHEVVFLNRVAFCSLRVGMCVLSLSCWVCFCQWWLVLVATITSLVVNMIPNGTTKRIHLFKAFVLWRVKVNAGDFVARICWLLLWLRFGWCFCLACLDCSEPFVVFLLIEISIGFRLFLVWHADGRKVLRNRVVSKFANCFFEWVLVAVVVMFSRVSEISGTLCLKGVGLRGHTIFDSEECALVFQPMLAMASTSPGMFPFRVWAWFFASVDRCWFNDGFEVFCVWLLMWSFMQHLRTCVQFWRRTVERLLHHVCVDVNLIFCVSCRQRGSERTCARGVASSFQRQRTVCVSFFSGCGVFFFKFALGIRAFFLNGFTDREASHK